ncbi:cyclin-J isoform X3 [Hippocampus zosterae]|uniref:cyclin-J isoform X3 n=1 Tax=Hippocampus zosterae TaxID=109293 RepID=UPI00223E1D54|nr:cyclin-J isoform X3 [Hippocampus zosterae]
MQFVVIQEIKLPSFKGQSPQLNLRRYFADLIAIISNHFRLCPTARHLAVYLLDLFMDRYDVTVQQLHMVSLSCLLLAIHKGDLHDGWPLSCLEKTKLYMAKYADYFLEVSLQDHVFLCFAPSLVAAACVAASRFILHVSPTWAPRLQQLTGYSWENLVPCAEKLLNAHDSDVKEANKQKCQQLGQQPQQQSQKVFHSSSQAAQYLHRSGMQYSQQATQPALAANHRPASYVARITNLQLSNGHLQGSSQVITALLDPKSNLTNRAYQVGMRYSCAPCFDR